MACIKVDDWINQQHLIIILYTFIQNIPFKARTDNYVSVYLHPCQFLSFAYWTNNIPQYVRTGDKAQFWNQKGYYFDDFKTVKKKITFIKGIEIMFI